MTHLGHIQDGQIVFDVPISLPKGTEVKVEVTAVAQGRDQGTIVQAKPLAERLANVIGTAKNLPPDASVNVDHYLYGLPKLE